MTGAALAPPQCFDEAKRAPAQVEAERDRALDAPADRAHAGPGKSIMARTLSRDLEEPDGPILLIGGEGFVGRHLAALLRARYVASAVLAMDRPSLDLTDESSVAAALVEHAPSAVVNLAGMAAPAQAARAGRAAWDLHLHAVEGLGRAILEHVPRAWLVQIGSGLAYGRTAFHGRPVRESEAMEPMDLYGASKAAGDLVLGAMASKGLRVARMRPFNHTGAGQARGFAVPDFAIQIARIEAGLQEPVLSVGNLEASRDFLHVDDVVAAYADVVAAGMAGRLERGVVFNVASGEPVAMRAVISRLLDLSKVPIELRSDPTRMRPSDLPTIAGDAGALRAATGWAPRRSLDDALRDVLETERAAFAAGTTRP